MNDDARERSVKAYFDGIAAKDMSQVPWAEDATLRTPLNPAGGENALIRGRKSILEFFNGILPAVSSLRFIRYYGGDGGWSAGQAEISLANGKTLYVMDAFLIESGDIVAQQNHYDSRAATG
ncbi:MAG TPA: nuclear transport factor 2 family protein [Candidatus Sulfotelmatobacter sp.]|nr:nuclear transport factor 2 family protein [Candidatus Sulfotelmatobacter sp.]